MVKLAAIVALILAGVGAWQIGNRLSTDAVAMAVGLVFGTLALLPVTLIVLLSNGHTRHDDDYGDEWHDAYRRGVATGKLMAPFQTRYSDEELTALALGIRPDGTRYGEPDRAQYDDVQTIDGTCTRYSVARPFAIVPAQPQVIRIPAQVDGDDWLFQELPDERRFRVDWGV